MPIRFATAVALLAALSAGPKAVSSPAEPTVAAGTRVVVPDSRLSYVPPPGWRTESSSLTGMDNKFCQAPFANGFAPTFSIGVRGSTASADHYLSDKAAEIIEDTPALHVLSRAPFATASGLRGGRILLDVRKPGAPRARRTLLYVLAAPHDQKICVITDTLSSDGSKYDAALDTCVKSFTLK